MFDKILIANRGEIAQRIISSCQLLGISTVAVFSDADRDALWVSEADQSFPLDGESATDTYLNQQAILEVADKAGAGAIHPGYGFLSENPEFAAACQDQGIVFIGPSAESMRLLGDKVAARALARNAGVPVIPGIDGESSTDQELLDAAKAIGYPVLVKASAGGGGRGMRAVYSASELRSALQAARTEALTAFGDDHLLLEKYFQNVHHVEVQVIGDTQGALIHLFERECSIQRRHQKIIEESPVPVLRHIEGAGKLIAEMRSAAVTLAKKAGYVNAGTVEFVLDATPGADSAFYFLEMNTRLQVEHPVTEMVTGIDMVGWQIRVAAGGRLPLKQSEVAPVGHAIECRIYAEDPSNMFLPSTGKIVAYQTPVGPGIRVDSGVGPGAFVSPYYDPMLAKIVCWGQDREEALRRMKRALSQTVVLGVTTNIPYLQDILETQSYQDGRTNTTFLQDQMSSWAPTDQLEETGWIAAGVLEQLRGTGRKGGIPVVAKSPGMIVDPWDDASGWRNVL
jgi:acetyl-CoA carboxylase biotin carboxylase subunit